MSLWIEIQNEYGTALAAIPQDEVVLDQVWQYLRWCRDEYDSDEMWTAVTVAFLEHLLQSNQVREDLPKRISLQEAREFLQCATYFKPPGEIVEYLRWFEKRRAELLKSLTKECGRRA